MDKKNPIRAKQMRREKKETGSTPMSFNALQNRRQKLTNEDDESLIDWDQSSVEQHKLTKVFANNNNDNAKKNKQ